jgi:hypothetical protein
MLDGLPTAAHLAPIMANAKIISIVDAEVRKARIDALTAMQNIEHMLLDHITTLTERVDQLREDVDKLMQK